MCPILSLRNANDAGTKKINVEPRRTGCGFTILGAVPQPSVLMSINDVAEQSPGKQFRTGRFKPKGFEASEAPT